MATSAETDELFGTSTVIKEIREDITCAARSDARVLLTGEAGTGKDFIAKLIHRLGPRRLQPFQSVNCAGLSGATLQGWLQNLHRGTLVLDQVSEASSTLQAAMLEFLDHVADVRIIATSNNALHDRLKTGGFRRDLFYRLNIIHIVVPPLRERRGDVGALVQEAIRRICQENESPEPELQDETLQALVDYSWPGNISELKGVIQRLVAHADGGLVPSAALPPEILEAVRSTSASDSL